MLSTLATVKSRLALDPLFVDFDDLLTTALTAISARFDRETNRTLTRTANSTFEFDASETEIIPPCYPIESVSKFETKSTEAEGWIEQTGIDFLVRNRCLLSLAQPLHATRSTLFAPSGRTTYTGGYVLPGTTPSAGQTPLPADLEQAAVEQVAAWFQHRDKLGLDTSWPHAATYEKFVQLPLLISVQTVLKRYERFVLAL